MACLLCCSIHTITFCFSFGLCSMIQSFWDQAHAHTCTREEKKWVQRIPSINYCDGSRTVFINGQKSMPREHNATRPAADPRTPRSQWLIMSGRNTNVNVTGKKKTKNLAPSRGRETNHHIQSVHRKSWTVPTRCVFVCIWCRKKKTDEFVVFCESGWECGVVGSECGMQSYLRVHGEPGRARPAGWQGRLAAPRARQLLASSVRLPSTCPAKTRPWYDKTRRYAASSIRDNCWLEIRPLFVIWWVTHFDIRT